MSVDGCRAASPGLGAMPVSDPDADVSEIVADASVSLVERMWRKQGLMNRRFLEAHHQVAEQADMVTEEDTQELGCGICLELCTRPVSASCQHNFCLKCFKKYVNHGNTKCPTCRTKLPKDLLQNPRVNTMLTSRLRKVHAPAVTVHVTHHKDSDRPDEAFTTENAKRKGLSNACSGRMRVTCPLHHFGPIGPEHDPERHVGVCVGDTWSSRLHCRQWGAHVPHVAGIAGQSRVGAQSIVLSGGFEDDRDEGEWLLYTGSGGKDLSGNKRTNKVQSADQVFEGCNLALVQSCVDGLPVRVLRSHKEKGSSYAPVKTDPSQSIRYDGVYKIIAAWRSTGMQGKLVCRYLLRRCDNSPAPWDTGNEGDGAWLRELPHEATQEMDQGQDMVLPHKEPFWGYDVEQRLWRWLHSPPVGKEKSTAMLKPTFKREETLILQNLAKCDCSMCKLVLTVPVCTPCGHQFCKACLEAKYAAEAPTDCVARPLRTRKQRKPCPVCNKELADFVEGPTFQVNRAMQTQIEKLQSQLQDVQAKLSAEKAAKVDMAAEQHEEEEESEEWEAGVLPTSMVAAVATASRVRGVPSGSLTVRVVQPSRVKYSCAPHRLFNPTTAKNLVSKGSLQASQISGAPCPSENGAMILGSVVGDDEDDTSPANRKRAKVEL